MMVQLIPELTTGSLWRGKPISEMGKYTVKDRFEFWLTILMEKLTTFICKK